LPTAVVARLVVVHLNPSSDLVDMEIVIMRTRKDYGVVMLELRITGLKRISCFPLKFPTKEMNQITRHLPGGYPLDMLLELMHKFA
jgi:hypothetical protein